VFLTKRVLCVLVALTLMLLLSPVLIVIALMIKATSEGPILYWSDRVGKDNKIFKMSKFRSMRINAPQLPTHLLSSAEDYLTPIGRFLRHSSFDELPQLWNILVGDMNFVGPRPALFNQDDLIALRTERGIHTLKPGLTGWAQVNGRDELPIPVKVQFDYEYMQRQSVLFDLRVVLLTVKKSLYGEGIRH